jgi:DNA-directed RNA polymerase specialized sigma24 family protein
MRNCPARPTARTWSKLPYEDDPFAQGFIAAHPEGMSLDDIARAMRIPRSQVTSIMQRALSKLEHNRRARRIAGLS